MAKGKIQKNAVHIAECNTIQIPSFITAYQAGKNNGMMDGMDYYDVPLVKGIKVGSTYAITVSGDSMAPKIIGGDVLIVDTNVTNFKPGDIVAVCLNGDYIVKVYEPGTMCLYLSSINQDYEPIRVYEKDECIILGKIIKIVRDI